MADILTALDRIVSACEPARNILASRERLAGKNIPTKRGIQSELNNIMMHGEHIKILAQSGLDVLDPEKAVARNEDWTDIVQIIKELNERNR